MQSIRIMKKGLEKLAHESHYLFSPNDLRGLLPQLSDNAFNALLSRASKEGIIERICRGVYIYPPANPKDGLILYHVAARLRADEFNYISLETALSDAGVISQVPINWITVMSSGRSHKTDCGNWGTIEFIHTRQEPTQLQNQLVYDPRCGFWRASVSLALRDMRVTRRSLDLIDWSVVNEFV